MKSQNEHEEYAFVKANSTKHQLRLIKKKNSYLFNHYFNLFLFI